jgi:hypothetical protein
MSTASPVPRSPASHLQPTEVLHALLEELLRARQEHASRVQAIASRYCTHRRQAALYRHVDDWLAMWQGERVLQEEPMGKGEMRIITTGKSLGPVRHDLSHTPEGWRLRAVQLACQVCEGNGRCSSCAGQGCTPGGRSCRCCEGSGDCHTCGGQGQRSWRR